MFILEDGASEFTTFQPFVTIEIGSPSQHSRVQTPRALYLKQGTACTYRRIMAGAEALQYNLWPLVSQYFT